MTDTAPSSDQSREASWSAAPLSAARRTRTWLASSKPQPRTRSAMMQRIDTCTTPKSSSRPSYTTTGDATPHIQYAAKPKST